MPGWAATLCALGLTGIGAFADIERLNHLSTVFEISYFLSCVLAVVAVRRAGLFGPMVQPPLILAVAVPSVILATGSRPTGGVITTALMLGTPLVNDFPTMAITTVVTIVIGLVRVITQRRPAPRRDR